MTAEAHRQPDLEPLWVVKAHRDGTYATVDEDRRIRWRRRVSDAHVWVDHAVAEAIALRAAPRKQARVIPQPRFAPRVQANIYDLAPEDRQTIAYALNRLVAASPNMAPNQKAHIRDLARQVW